MRNCAHDRLSPNLNIIPEGIACLKMAKPSLASGDFKKGQERLQKENSKLKGIIEELTVELKKKEEVLGQ